MKNTIYTILSCLKYLLILWIPILLVEETFIFDFVGAFGSIIISLILSIFTLIIYMKNYMKMNKEKINCYIYNIVNAILLAVSNIILGYLFIYLIDLNILHQCSGDGWSCFLSGIEYWLIGLEYAIISIIALIIWLIYKLIKYLNTSKKLN